MKKCQREQDANTTIHFHDSHRIAIAYVLGRRKDEVFLKLKNLLEPFGIKHYCTHRLGAYRRHLQKSNMKLEKRKPKELNKNTFD